MKLIEGKRKARERFELVEGLRLAMATLVSKKGVSEFNKWIAEMNRGLQETYKEQTVFEWLKDKVDNTVLTIFERFKRSSRR